MSEQVLKNVRDEFLKIFVLSLIYNSYRPVKKEIELHLQEELFTPSIAASGKKLEQLKPSITVKPVTKPFPMKPMPHAKSPVALPPVQPQRPLKPGEKPDSIHLGKVAQLLLDPAVVSVECGGPGRNLMVNRAGELQTAGVMLTKDEIDNIMNNFSEKTRIPLITGVFRAAFKDLLLTAVISEFVGTRFLIEKRYDYQAVEQ